MNPLAVDLCAGLGGWAEGLLAEGWDCVGFDIERHVYGDHKYPAQLVLQDILTLDGRQFRGKVSLIVASPPCQEFSYMAMPWTLAKAKAQAYRDHPETQKQLTALFDACVRIGREAECPIIIENVRGAQPWVGRSRWAWGSFHLWGDVPALMPIAKAMKNGTGGSWFGVNPDGSSGALNNARDGQKVPGFRFDGNGKSFQTAAQRYRQEQEAVKGVGIGSKSWGQGKGQRHPNDPRNFWSKSDSRKAASAQIAKIPFTLSSYIARVYRP